MSIISLHIDNLHKVQPGQYLQGQVIVRLNKRKTCKGIVIQLCWYTEGKGHYNAEYPVSVELTQVPRLLEPGQHVYPFRLQVPCGPFSYKGKMFRVHWQVEAVFKTGWPFAPRAYESFCLKPTAKLRQFEGPEFKPLSPIQMGLGSISFHSDCKFSSEPGLRLRDDTSDWSLLAFGLIWVSLSLIMLCSFISSEGGWILSPLVLPLLLPGLFACLPIVEQSLARCFLPQIELNLPSIARQGQSIDCAIKFLPRYDMRLQRVHFALKAQERCRYTKRTGSGNKRRSRTVVARHKLFFKSRSESPGKTLQAGKSKVCQAKFMLPTDAPLTFLAKDNQVVWQMTVTIQPKWLPSWSQSLKLQVHPS